MNPDVVHKPDAQEGQPIPATRKSCCLSFLVAKHKSFSAGGKVGDKDRRIFPVWQLGRRSGEPWLAMSPPGSLKTVQKEMWVQKEVWVLS